VTEVLSLTVTVELAVESVLSVVDHNAVRYDAGAELDYFDCGVTGVVVDCDVVLSYLS